MKTYLLKFIAAALIFFNALDYASAGPWSGQKFWYVLGELGDNNIYQFQQDEAGQLRLLNPPSVSSTAYILSVVATPNAQFLYAKTENPNTILQYRIRSDGQLSPLKPPSVAADYFLRILLSPNGRFLYCVPATSASIVVYKIQQNGQLSRLSQDAKTDQIPINMAFDSTGRFAYVICKVSLDPPSGNRKVDQFSVHDDGALTPIKPFSFWEEGAGADYLFTRPGNPYIYFPDSGGLSQYTIATNGQLVKPRQSIMNKSDFQVFATADEPYKLIVGTAGGDIVPYRQPDSIVVTRINPDNTLTVLTEYHVDYNGYLDQVVPGPRQTANQDNDVRTGGSDIDPNAALDSLAIDTDKQVLYVVDGSTFRTFRYRINPDGTLHLIVPYAYMGRPSYRHTNDDSHDSYDTSTQPYILSVTAK